LGIGFLTPTITRLVVILTETTTIFQVYTLTVTQTDSLFSIIFRWHNIETLIKMDKEYEKDNIHPCIADICNNA
jgi:hypothetical protein